MISKISILLAALTISAAAVETYTAPKPVPVDPITQPTEREIVFSAPVIQSDKAELKYQWKRDNVAIPAPDGTKAVLRLRPPFIKGDIVVVVTGPDGYRLQTDKVRILTTTSRDAPGITITIKQ